MLKRLVLLHWHRKQNKVNGAGLFKTLLGVWRQEGIAGVNAWMDNACDRLRSDVAFYYRHQHQYDAMLLRLLFITLFLITAGYYLVLKSELYESQTAIIVKNLNEKQMAADGLGILGVGISSQMQDAKIIEAYLSSPDILSAIDTTFHLKRYFQSDALDVISRLPPNATFEAFLETYRQHLNVVYDEVSGILHVAFCHTNPVAARDITAYLIKHTEQQLNVYNKRNARKQLQFVEAQVAKNKEALDTSTRAMEAYQNEHLLLDPYLEAQTRNNIIASLESTLVKKEAEHNQMQRYMSKRSFELIKLKNEIEELKRTITQSRKALTGSDHERLNALLFAFERLKAKAAFDAEVYKQSLLQLELARVDTSKQGKVIVKITEPNLPDGYTYPDKPKKLITLMIAFLLLYGIVSMLRAIINEHKD